MHGKGPTIMNFYILKTQIAKIKKSWRDFRRNLRKCLGWQPPPPPLFLIIEVRIHTNPVHAIGTRTTGGKLVTC